MAILKRVTGHPTGQIIELKGELTVTPPAARAASTPVRGPTSAKGDIHAADAVARK